MSYHDVNTSRVSDEWYTPACVWKEVESFFGGIDLDPSSNSNVSPNVPARKVYTIDDDGLSQPWKGKVFLNPPYSHVRIWVQKLVSEIDAGNVTEATVFPKVDTSTKWFKLIFHNAQAILFYGRRLKFANSSQVAPFASCLAYFGKRAKAFQTHFANEGKVVLL